MIVDADDFSEMELIHLIVGNLRHAIPRNVPLYIEILCSRRHRVVKVSHDQIQVSHVLIAS